MANAEWLEIFRSYEPAELDERIAKLKKQVDVFTSQSIGSKTYVKDLNELRGQLSAAVRVKNARAGRGAPSVTVTDFSGRNR